MKTLQLFIFCKYSHFSEMYLLQQLHTFAKSHTISCVQIYKFGVVIQFKGYCGIVLQY